MTINTSFRFLRLLPFTLLLATACPPADGNGENGNGGNGNGNGEEPLPLDLFVDDTEGFSYEEVWSESEGGMDTFVLRVDSQTWRSAEEVDRTLWQHDVVVAVPASADPSIMLVVVGGGRNGRDPPGADSGDVELARTIALAAGAPVMGVSQIPNQPLTITGEGGERWEDALVAASWHKVLETQDPTWSAYFPMARGVIRCMDAVQDHMAQQGDMVEGFVVTGFSKRGATTYLVTAVDERVLGMAPGVFDFLNFVPQARHHLDVYGEPAPAVIDYAEYDMLERVELPEAEPLLQTSDPYSYRHRYTMPSLILASPGDQFFLPDSMRFYLDELPGEPLVRYVPNSGHSLEVEGGSMMDLIGPTLAWFGDVVEGNVLPSLSWALAEDILTLQVSPRPQQVRLWTATNPGARNFRYDVIGAAWESQPVAEDSSGSWTAEVAPPEQGFTAFFMEATLGSHVYTTQVYVTPDE